MSGPDELATQVTGVESTTKYLERGSNVGRYVVLDRVGEGGMGIVYRAFDPELDRMVALKVLHVRAKTGTTLGDASWLLREAQALARLSHPNVVIVHDVGALAADQVFVAMELVDGITLRDWLRQDRRSWREVRDVMLAAGAGLAAAHAAKLVHRDVKPENIIVGITPTGAIDRVRMMDFGLARHRSGDSTPPERISDMQIEVKSPLETDLTVVEGVIGTPAYMAPELFEGNGADARSDQFSFGVVLFEALCGARPFAKVALVPTKDTPKPEIPATAKVPARVAAVALRAISIDPADRYASMDALLAELAIDPTARRRRVAIGAALVAALAITIGATSLVARGESQVCKGIDRRLAGIWDPATKQVIRTAYIATKLASAPKAYAVLEPALDQYAGAWLNMAVESCAATRIRRDQTEEVLSLRDSCLARRLIELGALTKLLVEPSKSVIEKADSVAFELEPLDRCADVAALREPGAPPPDIAPKLVPIETLLAEAKAQLIAGHYLPALTAATSAAKDAKSIGYNPVVAEAENVRGASLLGAGNNEDAAATIEASVWDAEAAKRDDLVARGALSLAWITAEAFGKPAEAKVWLALGTAAAKRAGRDPKSEVFRFKVEGLVAADLGDLPAAVAAQQQAFAAAQHLYGYAGPVLSGDEALFAGTLVKAYEYAKAVPHFEHAIALRSQIVGMDHQDIALMLSNLAVAYQHTGDMTKAHATFERALALREKLFGAQSPILVATLDNYAVFSRIAGDLPRALALIERAEPLAALYPGKDNYAYHIVVTDRAEILAASGRNAEARAAYDEALALETKAHSTALPTTQTSRAELALAEHAWADAAALAAQAVASFESAGGPDNPELWRPLTVLGRADKELHKPADARPLLERGLAIGERIHLTPAELAPARDALAHLGS